MGPRGERKTVLRQRPGTEHRRAEMAVGGCTEHPVEETESQTEGHPRAEDGRKEWEKTPSDRKRLAAAA